MINMMSKEEDSKPMNSHKINKREELHKSGEDADNFLFRTLKEMLLMFALEMGRGGCPICTCSPSSF